MCSTDRVQTVSYLKGVGRAVRASCRCHGMSGSNRTNLMSMSSDSDTPGKRTPARRYSVRTAIVGGCLKLYEGSSTVFCLPCSQFLHCADAAPHLLGASHAKNVQTREEALRETLSHRVDHVIDRHAGTLLTALQNATTFHAALTALTAPSSNAFLNELD